VDAAAPLEVRLPGDPPSAPAASARPAGRAPAVDPARRSADLLYEMPNPGRRLLKGQSLAVGVPLLEKAKALTVPAAAVVASVTVFGGDEKQYQLVDPERLRAAGVTLDEVRRAARGAVALRQGAVDTRPAASGAAAEPWTSTTSPGAGALRDGRSLLLGRSPR
jgi:hypothetical protein